MKASSRAGIVIAFIVILLSLGLAAYTTLEIYPRKYPVAPSAEAYSNKYLALSRWLAKTGHPLRFESRGTVARIAAAKERVVLVEASVCDWSNAADFLLPWLRGGGSLLVILDDFYDDVLDDFISLFGISAYYDYDDDDYNDDDYEDEENNADEDYKKHWISVNDSEDSMADDALIPDFDEDYGFVFTEAEIEDIENISVIRDSGGTIRLVTADLHGGGSVTFTGNARYMFSRNLHREANARLAWNLTAARTTTENPKVLFFRYKHVRKGLFGNIAERGNFLPLGISALLLLVIGFWMVLPRFGITPRQKQLRARPIRERFLAEIRFLKKYNALDYYIKIYLRELKTKFGVVPENKIAEIAASLQSGEGGKPGNPVSRFNRSRDIIQNLKELETVSESIQWNR